MITMIVTTATSSMNVSPLCPPRERSRGPSEILRGLTVFTIPCAFAARTCLEGGIANRVRRSPTNRLVSRNTGIACAGEAFDPWPRPQGDNARDLAVAHHESLRSLEDPAGARARGG